MLVYCDPSYTGLGIYWVSSIKKVSGFALLSQGQTKKSLQNYLEAAFKLRDQFKQLVSGLYVAYHEDIEFIIEAPFPGGMSSCGLYGLQFLIQDYLLNGCSAVVSVKSLSPSYIHSFVMKEIKEKVIDCPSQKDNIASRKALAAYFFSKETNKFKNEELLIKHSGGDVATAYLFAKGLEIKPATLVELK